MKTLRLLLLTGLSSALIAKSPNEFVKTLSQNIKKTGSKQGITADDTTFGRIEDTLSSLENLLSEMTTWTTKQFIDKPEISYTDTLSGHQKRFTLAANCLKNPSDRCTKLKLDDQTDAAITTFLAGTNIWHTLTEELFTKGLLKKLLDIPTTLLGSQALQLKALPAEIATLNKNLKALGEATALVKPFAHMLVLTLDPSIAPLVTQQAQSKHNNGAATALAPYNDPDYSVDSNPLKPSELNNFLKKIGS